MKNILITKLIRPDALLAEVGAALSLPVVPGDTGTLFLTVEASGALYLHIPDSANEVTAQAVIDAHNPAVVTVGDSAFSNILSMAQSAVGVKLVDLTAAQIKALLAVMLYKAGGVNIATMTVNPLAQWVSRR